MVIKVADTAGFCFGVDRIVKKTLSEAEKGKVYTFGPIVHNKFVISEFEKKGVEVIADLKELTDKPPGILIIRAHGVPPEITVEINLNGIKCLDYTCPFVKRIHKIVSDAHSHKKKVIILGDKNHPEIVGVNGYTEYSSILLKSPDDINKNDFEDFYEYVLVAQTTFDRSLFEKMTGILSGLVKNLKIHNTICRATKDRQEEAFKLSKSVDYMVVLGDRYSSNSEKLYKICSKNQKNTFFIESIKEIEEKLLNIFKNFDIIIGVTAGASTPPAIIKEAVKRMSDLNNNPNAEQNFANMIDGVDMVLRTGDTVKGTVIKVTNGEVFVDLGYKSDGIIQKGQYSDDSEADPAVELKAGDEIEVYVLRVNDGEGNVLLSKKRADGRKSMIDIEEAHKNGTPLKGKIIEVIKGGCIALIQGVRTFVPTSQAAHRFIHDLNEIKGKEFNFNILEFDRAKRRIVAGRRDLSLKEIQEKKEKAFSTIKVGDKLKGTVSRIAQFGAFVDLGGVDGLIHISEMSWGRIRKVTDALKEGDQVVVTVIDIDPEKGKISLTLKDIEHDPWYNIEEKYPIGSIVDGKVARIASFGAFVELEDGVDGLVHISQVASRHIEKVEEELKIGQMIKVKVTAIDTEQKRVSLSKKVADNEIYFEYIEDEPTEPAEENSSEDNSAEPSQA